jgi:hypothetical protein
MYIFYVLVVMLGEAQRRIYLGIYAVFGLGNCFWCGIWLATWLGYAFG